MPCGLRTCANARGNKEEIEYIIWSFPKIFSKLLNNSKKCASQNGEHVEEMEIEIPKDLNRQEKQIFLTIKLQFHFFQTTGYEA
jgi:hypothetical protein